MRKVFGARIGANTDQVDGKQYPYQIGGSERVEKKILFERR